MSCKTKNKCASETGFQLLQSTKTKLWFFTLPPRFNEIAFGSIKNKNSKWNTNFKVRSVLCPKLLWQQLERTHAKTEKTSRAGAHLRLGLSRPEEMQCQRVWNRAMGAKRQKYISYRISKLPLGVLTNFLCQVSEPKIVSFTTSRFTRNRK